MTTTPSALLQDRVLGLLRTARGRRVSTGEAELLVFDRGPVRRLKIDGTLIERLVRDGLIIAEPDGALTLTPIGAARVARQSGGADGFRGQHGTLMPMTTEAAATGEGSPAAPERARAERSRQACDRPLVALDESPLSNLAHRRDRDGRAWIEPVHVVAGDRLRADFTRGQLTPRVTSDWSALLAPTARSSGRGGMAELSDTALAARERVTRALRAVGPELQGVLLDVCCFLKGLEQVEAERRWPARSAKLVLRLALESLARHYGLSAEARGPASSPIRTARAPA